MQGEPKSAEGLLILMALRGVGPATAEKIASRYKSFEEVEADAPHHLGGILPHSWSPDAFSPIELRSAWVAARRTLEQADNLGVQILSVFDADYPAALRAIPDRPAVIYVRGSLEGISRSVACIGTREPSEFGATAAAKTTEFLAANRWTIVSGLALGIDTIAHESALRAGGRTVAVMAGGLDSIYPKANRELADQILESGGALVSEQPFGAPAAPHNLVQRDRLQSGLSAATIVFQTDIKGGSMHTVRFTILQNRLLVAPVPHGKHAEEAKSRGILALTKCNGPQFAETIKATGEYERLLNRRYLSRSVAFPIEGSKDYQELLALLEKRLSVAEPATGPEQLAML